MLTGCSFAAPVASRLATQTLTAVPTTVKAATPNAKTTTHPLFDGTHAFDAYLVPQMRLGPRPVGTAADRATADLIAGQLQQAGWNVVTQDFSYRGVPGRNVIGKAAVGKGPIIILGAHYDTRRYADQDKEHADQPVPGANDGASGVAVLLELARTVDVSKLKNEVWLAFFDAEDDGELDMCPQPARAGTPSATPVCDHTPWPWSVGSSYMATHLTGKPSAVVIVDMIGDKDQNIYYERNSDVALQQDLWAIAGRLGYSAQFIPEFKWSMDDDHTPFLQRGIRAVDIIDFDYPYWHTVQDTIDKVSPESLERVGRVLQTWLEGE